MYNERREGFSIRDVIVQLLFLVLFVFILIWLFPTKSDLKNSLSGIGGGDYDVLTNRIFHENVQTMKDAAIGYYTTPRLPKKVKDTKSMTLGEMINYNLIIPFEDANGKACDLDKSYVEITKYEDEYRMTVNLKCSDNDAHIIVYLGCYDYCDADVCESEKKPVSKPVNNNPVKPTTPTKPTKPEEPKKPEEPVKPTPTPVSYEYKYVKEVDGGYSSWSNWSNWTTTKSTETNLRDVETQTATTYVNESKVIGYKNVTTQDKNQPVYAYTKVQIGTTTTKECEAYKTEIVYTGEYKGEWKSEGKALYFITPKDTATVKFVYISSTDYSCGTCVGGTAAYYEKLVYNTYQVTTEKKVCSSYKTVSTPVYGTVKTLVGYKTVTTQEPVYGYVQVPKTTTYYKTRTRTYNAGYKIYKWSDSSNNRTLINSGYTYTGERRKK
ncbi:MAG: hypothetical protein PHO63_02565 [Bacilli bacterium]|nr:hypothetical protein [Bacilli bacterium]MDD4809385.1 hypothetical protein [Bacilli bacterium]